MTATTQVETIIVVRPLKVISFICCCLTLVMLMVCLASTFWLQTSAYRQGIWKKCVAELPENTTSEEIHPYPFDTPPDEGCSTITNPDGWLKAVAALCILCIIANIIATIVIGVGLCTRDRKMKKIFYKLSMYLMLFGVAFLLTSLVIFPCKFSQEMDTLYYKHWSFGWAYGLAWAAALCLFFGAIFLIFDGVDEEEVFYKERQMIPEA